MSEHNLSFAVDDFQRLRSQLLSWASRFNSCSFLDNHGYESPYHQHECLIGVGARYSLQCNAGGALAQLEVFLHTHQDQWIFGHLGYDLKNEIEDLRSSNENHIRFPDLYFFVPEIVVRLDGEQLHIQSSIQKAASVFGEIKKTEITASESIGTVAIHPRISREDYLQTINQIREHIRKGDCYELNFCQEFHAKNSVIDPLDIYQKLGTVSPNPFSVLYKVGHRYLLCASPERYLMRKGDRLLSQPIKGTAPRNLQDANLDELQKEALVHSHKERSENVMIVDLVRNDLSKICEEGSVQVDELFGIYTYPQVHQMISTISGTLQKGTSFTDIIKATFPMGSMTGAPKKRVMQLIERYEQTKRGLYSGAVGYISPNGDFDFNVVIRSILYNEKDKYISYQVGGAITFQSDAEKEYEECILKASAIRKVLEA